MIRLRAFDAGLMDGLQAIGGFFSARRDAGARSAATQALRASMAISYGHDVASLRQCPRRGILVTPGAILASLMLSPAPVARGCHLSRRPGAEKPMKPARRARHAPPVIIITHGVFLSRKILARWRQSAMIRGSAISLSTFGDTIPCFFMPARMPSHTRFDAGDGRRAPPLTFKEARFL